MHIFISYSRADWLYVQEIARALRRRGIATWVDIENLQPGERWAPAVHGAIDTAIAFIICLSPLCIESHHTSRELRRALDAGKPVFPVMIEQVEIALLLPELAERQIIELWRYPARLAAQRASRRIVECLGLDTDAISGMDADADDASGVLLLNFGQLDTLNTRPWVCGQLGIADHEVIERTVESSADYPLVEHLIARDRAVFFVLGASARTDACVLLLGAVLGAGGGPGPCVLYHENHQAFVRSTVAPLRVRAVMLETAV